MKIYRNDWHLIGFDQIKDIVKKEFNVRVLPNDQLCQSLAKQQKAMLELIEIRTKSVAYRIRQIDEVFYIGEKHYDKVYTTQEYNEAKKPDDLIRSIKQKDVVFKGQQMGDDNVKISYLKDPRFSMYFSNELLQDITWENEEPDMATTEKLKKKGFAFFNSFFSRGD